MPKKRALLTGSYDPITYGHLYLLSHSLKIFDEVVVGIGKNASKKTFFSLEERMDLINDVIAVEFPSQKSRIKIVSFAGLLVDAARELKIDVVLRGVRNEKDFSYERDMFEINRALGSTFETLWIPTDPTLKCISASLIWQIATMNGDISMFVSSGVAQAVYNKLKKSSS